MGWTSGPIPQISVGGSDSLEPSGWEEPSPQSISRKMEIDDGTTLWGDPTRYTNKNVNLWDKNSATASQNHGQQGPPMQQQPPRRQQGMQLSTNSNPGSGAVGMWGGAQSVDNGTAAWGQALDAAAGWGEPDDPNKSSGWRNSSPNPAKPGTKSAESWGGKGDIPIAASRHSSWEEEDDGGGGVWNSTGSQGSGSSFNSGGWGQTHGGKRSNIKSGPGDSWMNPVTRQFSNMGLMGDDPGVDKKMEGDKRGITDYNGEMRRGGRGGGGYRMPSSKDMGSADMGIYGEKVGGHGAFGAGGGGMPPSRGMHQPGMHPMNPSQGLRAQVPHQFLSPQVPGPMLKQVPSPGGGVGGVGSVGGVGGGVFPPQISPQQLAMLANINPHMQQFHLACQLLLQQQQQQQHFLQQQQMQKQVLQHQNQQVVPHQQQTTALPPQLQQPPHISQLFGHEPGQDIPQDGFLLGCVFAVADYPEQMADKQLLATWKRVIQACGGVVDPTLTSRCTHLLCESQVSNMYVQALREGKRCVTAHWLSTVLKKKKMVPPRRTLHLPFAFPPGAKPCSQHIISVTGFVDADRDDLKLMTYLAGARYTGYLCRSNTVLICKESSGLKYEKAKEWKIPCVNAQWLCDILLGNFEALRQIQHSRYSIFTHPEPLAPNLQLVHNLLAAWRSPVKVTSEALSNLQLLQRQKISDSTNAPANKKARMEEIQSPSKRIPPESAPQVMFTGFEPMQVQQYTKRLCALGGEVADSSQKATHLMATKVTRTIKFLTAMSLVKYIITPEWLEESWRSQKFVDEVPYTLRDAEAEVLFGFSLEEALKKAHDALLFKGKYFYLTPGVCPSLSTMKAILESAGGKLLAKQPSYRKIMEHKQNKNLPEIILVSCDNDLHLCREYFMRNIDVHNAEFILTGVLTQKLDYESYPFLQKS
uniref:PAX-interacting protein 1 n=2 Tax=Nothobranchius pienaari TaxID=704102 RepID=A0A1A8M865_9TELE